MALIRLPVSQLTLLESKRGYNMVPNKKGLQVVMKNTFTPGWENRIFTLIGEKQINGRGNVYYPVMENVHPVNRCFMVPLNSLKLLILNKQEKEN